MAQYSGWQSPGYSNPNLLINWDFRSPVNRRGKSSYTNFGYTIDMWGINGVNGAAVKCEIFDEHIRLTAGEGNLYFTQAFETVLDTATTYTISIAFNKTNISTVTTKPTDGYFDFGNGVQGTLENGLGCHFVVLAGNAVDVYSVKLEVGTVSTLQADILNPIPYEYRLLRCLQYDLEGNYIGAVAASNPNLLINWDFRNPVNQRGQSSYTTIGYGLDMWHINRSSAYNTELTVNSGYISLKPTGGNLWMEQKFEQNLADNTVYNVSVVLKNGDIKSVQLTTSNIYTDMALGLQASIGTKHELELVALTGHQFDIQAVKLEVGTVSTLALDLMQPSNYADELHKCQRYFYRLCPNGNLPLMIGCNNAFANNVIYPNIDLPQPMRIVPTTAVSSANAIVITTTGVSGAVPITSVNHNAIDSTKQKIALAVNATLATGLSYNVMLKDGEFIDFNAEL